MTKKMFVGGTVIALAVALTAGGLMASNMGFKLNYTLNQAAVGVSNSGTNTLALPDFRQSGLNDAKQLMDDIGFAQTQNVQKFLEASDTLQVYTGRKGGGTAFALTAGEGVYVKMTTTVNYIAVGSDDPTVVYPLNAAQVGVSNSGTNFFAYNYHQTAGDAKALMDDIGFANVQNVQKFLKASDTLQVYTGRKGGGTAFALVPGEAYYVKMATTVNYTPSHY
jgi:2-phospho-L-lactate guanylyltransferase (CobY/MobA/RfbA family)